MKQDDKYKLQEAVKHASLASHASDLVLRELLEKRKSEAYSKLIYTFDDGKDCTRIIAELSALEKVQTDLRLLITRGDVAAKKLEKETEEHA